jgi:hypothetical protein
MFKIIIFYNNRQTKKYFYESEKTFLKYFEEHYKRNKRSEVKGYKLTKLDPITWTEINER